MTREIKEFDTSNDWLGDNEGELAIDVYQNEDSIIIKAPIAGVKAEDLDISITNDTLNIKGHRKETSEISQKDYFCQECYWGVFSKTYTLPLPVDGEKSEAILKNGILTITVPKLEKTRTKNIKIKTEE